MKAKPWCNNPKIKWTVLLLTFTAAFALYYICCKRTMAYYNSDAAYYAIAGKDIMSGNIFLNNWYGASNSLYFLALLYGFFGQVFGYSPELICIASAFLWASLFMLIAYIILCLYPQKLWAYAARLCLVFILCVSSCFFLWGEKIFAGAHFDVVLIGIFYIWVISREIELCKNCTFQLTVASILLLLSLWSDGLTKIFIVLPVLAGLTFNLLFVPMQEIKKNYIKKHLILCAALLAGSKIIFKLLQSNIGMIISFPVSGVDVPDYTELFPSIAYFIKVVLYIFGCDVFGQHIGTESIILIFRALILLFCCVALGLSLKTIIKNIFNHFMLLCLGMVTLIVIFTRYGGDTTLGHSWTSRLMFCFYFPLVLLFAQIDWERMASLVQVKANKKVLLGIEMLAASLIVIFNLSLLSTEEDRADKVIDPFVKVAEVLVERGRGRGYGTYWLSSAVTLASELQVDVRPVLGQDLSAFCWLSKDTSDWEYADFVLVDKSMWGEVTEESIIDCIGVPTERIQVDETIILIWDKNIMPYINNSGYGGPTIRDWWELEDGQIQKVIEATSNHFFSYFSAGENGYYTSDGEGYLLYGPYKSLKDGVYNITFEYSYEGELESGTVLGQVDVNSSAQKAEFTSQPAVAGVNSATLENVKIFPGCEDLEARFYANTEGVTVWRIVIERIET